MSTSVRRGVAQSVALSVALAVALLTASTLPSGAAQAGPREGVTVDVKDTTFVRPSVKVPLGETVTWRFQDAMEHSSTSDDGFWDSELKSQGETFEQAFPSAGSFDYSCTTHDSMHGRVRVKPTATGTPKGGYTLTWATVRTDDRALDVQTRTGSGRWETWLANTSSLSGRFDRAGTGTWQIRARTRDTATREVSGWSPALKVSVR